MPNPLHYKIEVVELSGATVNLDRYHKDNWRVIQMVPSPDGKKIVLLMERGKL